jgi:DnaK suppressor protein
VNATLSPSIGEAQRGRRRRRERMSGKDTIGAASLTPALAPRHGLGFASLVLDGARSRRHIRPMTTGDASVNGGLSQEQLDFLRARLEQLRMDLRARLDREQSTAREAEPLVESIDAAEQTREQDDAISFADRDRARLREVEDALRRMAAGSYGVSVISGEPIAFNRLLAVPWARYDADEEPGR